MDWVEGLVTGVVDGDTFDMRVELVGNTNVNKYNAMERVRIAGVDKPERATAAGRVAKAVLAARLMNKYVRCNVQARDTYRRLVCTYRVVPPR